MPVPDNNHLELLQEFRHRPLGTVESDLMGQPGQLVQIVRHTRKAAYDGSLFGRVPDRYRRLKG